MGQASSSSSGNKKLGSFDFGSSNFFGEVGKEPASVLQSDTLRPSHLAKLSELLPLLVSLTRSQSVDRGCPRTTSYGIGVGGGRYVSGIDVCKFRSTKSPAANAEAAPSWDVKNSCSCTVGGHCQRKLGNFKSYN